MVEYFFGCNLHCTTHIITYLSHMRTCIILSHFNTTMKNMPRCILTDRYNYIIFKYHNLTILHLGTSLARLSSVEPTHLILKCQDLENYFKAPWLSAACPGVCAWRLRQTMRRGKAALSLVGIFGAVWPLPSTSLTSSRQPEVSLARITPAKMWLFYS